MKNFDLLFYHPTTIVTVDDVQYFCDSFEKAIRQKGFQAKAFVDPHELLGFIHHEPSSPSWRWLEWEGHDSYYVDKETLQHILHQQNRYKLISVAISDMRMPIMDGLTFFKKVPIEKSIRRVLLTGAQTFEEGVELLNDEEIDCFVAKGSIEVLKKILDLLPMQMELYFRQVYKRHVSKMNTDIVESDSYVELFLKEMDQGFLTALLSSTKTEFYTVCTNGSRIFMDNKGQMSGLLVYRDKDFERFVTDLTALGRSEEDIRKVKERKMAPAFGFWDLKSAPLIKVKQSVEKNFYYSRLNHKELAFLGLKPATYTTFRDTVKV